jgi:hypothetical protein
MCPEEKKKLPAVGAAQRFTIVRIGAKNVKKEIIYGVYQHRTDGGNNTSSLFKSRRYGFVPKPIFFQRKYTGIPSRTIISPGQV